jgi:hypothetical protein
VGGVCPEDDEWAVRRARRERTLMMIDGRGCCKGAMRFSKWVVG